MRASVVVPTYRRPLFLLDCLTSIASQTAFRDILAECIIVDADPHLSALSVWLDLKDSFPCDLRYIPTSGVGASEARNIGARAAASDIVAFIDDDCIADPDWLRYIIDAFGRHDSDVVGCRIIARPW